MNIKQKFIQKFSLTSNSYKDIWKLPVGIFLILLLTISPLFIGILGAEIYKFFTGNTCNEANCFWMVIPWFTLISIPLGLILAALFLLKCLKDLNRIQKK